MNEIPSVKIVQVDGKDLYLTSNILDEAKIGYSIVNKFGLLNIKRFRANLDFSLELIKLRQVYQEVFGKDEFSFSLSGFDYTKNVCSVTFKFSVKLFNRVAMDTYARYDVDYRKAEFVDCVWVKDGELLGVQVNKDVQTPLDAEALGKGFVFEDGKYKSTDKFKTILPATKVREWLYKNGFYMDGIHFVRYKRSAGSARTGKCLFINDKLYPKMHEWEMCGLNISEGDDCDLAGLESYISLTASSIIGAIEIKPENILLVDDYESVFKDNVVAVEQGEDGHLIATEKEVEISNSIWDGESLIDRKLMGEYKEHGFILLRNSFFKSAAFNCNLQKWFKDNGITKVSQLNGKTYAKTIDQVLYITTPSSIKYLKYGTFEDWLKNISTVFGIVKYEKKPKYLNGKGVKVSYQLINSLAMDRQDVKDFIKPSLDYLDLIKHNVAAFRWHVHFKSQRETDIINRTKNDVIFRLLGISDEFVKTKLFADFRRDSIISFISELKLGHVIVNGNYEVLAGNVFELLQQAIGHFKEKSILGYGNIHTKRFEVGKRLLCCRSPHTSSGNVMLADNVENKLIDRYFNFTTEIVAVNSIRENILQRLSGADFDSDTILITDDEVLTRCAAKYYNTFKVPTMMLDASKKKRKYTSEDKTDLDVTCYNDNIGIIVNLSQEINTIMWDRVNRTGNWPWALEAYRDNCLLSILASAAIDSTKREYPIDFMEELRVVRSRYCMKDKNGRDIRPSFFAHVAKKKGYYDPKRKYYMSQMAPMDYLQDIIDKYKMRGKKGPRSTCTIGDLMKEFTVEDVPRQGYVDLVIAMITEMDAKIRSLYQVKSEIIADGMEKRELASRLYTKCIESIRNMHLTPATIKELLIQMDAPENSKIHRRLWTILFGSLDSEVGRLFKGIKHPVYSLEECKIGDAEIFMYGVPFKRRSVA